jgi:glycosyltransferase involved in cell wall biosynthesis
MKIALIHDHLVSGGGGEQVLKAFCELFPDAPIYTLIYAPERAPTWLQGKQVITSFLQKLPFGTKKYQWYLPLRTFATESFQLDEYDVVLSNSSAHAKGVVTNKKTLHINYCHTPTRYLWIDTQRLDPLERIWPISWLSDQYKKYLRMWDMKAAQRVDSFIANSRNVQRRISNIYKRESAVIHPPVNIEPYNVADDLGEYYLAGGRLVAYKRFDIIVQAFTKTKIPLKIFGAGPDEARLRELAGPNIEFLGRVHDRDLPTLYGRALAYIHPQEEDFGITPVESMASGRPVIAYKAGGVLETVKEGETGEFFLDQDWQALADKVIRFDPQKYDSQGIRQHAEQYTTLRFKERVKGFIDSSWNEFDRVDG